LAIEELEEGGRIIKIIVSRKTIMKLHLIIVMASTPNDD
jgi:hypothetical protein